MKTREEATKYGLSFPDTYLETPFHDPNWELVRVHGSKKAFLWVYERNGYINLNVKVRPEWRDFWRDAYASVLPGYHQNKEHWNTIILDGTIPDKDVKQMIAESYDIITDSPTKRIYEAVKTIPKGKVATYGRVAELAGNPRMSRAVGNALHHNPDPEHIPCYRVVNSKGELAGAFAFGGEHVQEELLKAEGIEVVKFKENYTQQLQRLNEYQKAAVFDESSACLVNANVGSGKTTVLITKVMYLHYEKQIPYEQMVVLTFTNKAADEIKERLHALEPEITEEQLWGFGTFHSVCLTMLKKMLPVENLGYTKEFMVMDPDEEFEMAEQLILTYQLKIKYKNRLKKRLEQKNSKYQDDIEKLKALLKEEKRRQDKMTFDELLDNTCKLVKMSAEIEEVSKKNANLQDNENTGMQDISWIIVDEVQDSDEKQLELIDCLKKTQTCFFAVGDPNQVIYSWRGSAFHIFYQLKTKYQATELTLPVNYRSSSEILAVARCFMQQGDTLQGGRENGDKIQIRNMYDPFQEADYLAGRIRDLHASGLPYREMAIFYRLQNQSEIFEHVFEKEGIPFEVSLKKTVKDIPVLDWLIRVLRFSVNPKDKSSGIAALADKRYGLGMSVKEAEKTIDILSETRKTQTETPQSEKQKINSDIRKQMLGFSQAYFNAQSTTAEDLWSYFSLENHLHPTTASYEEDRTYVMDFFTRMITYQKEQQKNVVEGFSEFLNMASLYGMNILKKEIHNENDTVKLMTLHASKGLEFSHVFITGVNYGLIPLQTKSFEEEEEEQRLFFVGITRAKEHLELSYYTSPGQYRAAPGPSRYLRMIPENLIEGQEKDRESSATHLQDLKRQILAERAEHIELQEAGKISGGKNPSANTGTKNISAGNETVTTEKRRVRHTKYGTGSVVREDDMMLTVDFDDYGEKELMKMFSGLEELP